MATDETMNPPGTLDLTYGTDAQEQPSFGSRLRFGLAGFLRCSERILDGLVSGYERMCSLDERDTAEIYRTMGEDFARRGNDCDAIGALENTLALQPDSATARLQLGLLYLRQGSPAAALEALEEVKVAGLRHKQVILDIGLYGIHGEAGWQGEHRPGCRQAKSPPEVGG